MKIQLVESIMLPLLTETFIFNVIYRRKEKRDGSKDYRLYEEYAHELLDRREFSGDCLS